MRETDKYHFFWRGLISQWAMRPFTDTKTGIKYNCAEQFMMHQKALLFNDKDTAKQIMEACHPREQQKLGRIVRNYDQAIWDENKMDIVSAGNYLKFTQDDGLKNLLLATEERILVEASPYDVVWGVGIGENDDKILDENNWRGENCLGKCLMRVRDTIGS